ncbi:MAG: hypothetical protein K2K48_05665 [Anaeroplasmataceae bacterium]|nr:hypothetical protein [Anaeroplasmataceae bacterium]MDE6414882.1 hypothetical protein [Anaeroplasmataceae bacterium]
MRLRKYMIVDLAILTCVGFVAELFGEYVINRSIVAGWVAGSISLLILLISTTRWGWKGLLPIPILALAVVLSGRYFHPIVRLRPNYDWKFYIVLVISYLSISINLFWMKKIGYKDTFKKLWLTILLCTVDYLVFQLVLSIVFWIIMKDFLFLAFIIWNAFTYVILLVGSFILGKQNALVNIKLSLLEKSEEERIEEDFKMQFEETKIEKEIDQEGDSKDGKNS